ncbi:hypothetical protein K466DRAFT_565439 [Polyporus arcularius HHB13444]|uniref:DUF7770 domain-containing protein n=1 Tax=Polyporus arcularius HHB13444 TaxID=1314778 RepID=A0A5C3PCN2_9APHY|nr:hypothetical protein K466DRAFT_565439 [Polyporus arcularius HHB13444]
MPMQMPPMQFPAYPETVGAQTQSSMQPQYGVSPLMHHPSEMHMQTQAMYGQTQAMYGQTQAMYGQTQAMYGQTQAMYGQPQAMYGQMQVPLAQTANPPQMMMGGHDLQRTPAPPAPPFTQSRNAVGPPTDRPVAFHLRLFFQFASGQSSIELHQRSSGMADNKAIATFRNYVVTTHNVFDGCVVPSESLEGFTMAEVKRVVFDKNKRHLYRFVNETGCAYWALEVIGDLEKAQLLKSGAKARCTDQYHEWAVRRRKEDELPYHPAKGEWLPV